MNIPRTVKALLKQYGNSTNLAAKLGCTSRAVEQWASGSRSPRGLYRDALEALSLAHAIRRNPK